MERKPFRFLLLFFLLIGALGVVTQVNPAWSQTAADTPEFTKIKAGEGPYGVAIGFGSVWVANNGDGTVSRIDPRHQPGDWHH